MNFTEKLINDFREDINSMGKLNMEDVIRRCVSDTAKEIKNELDYSGDVETGFSYAKEKCEYLITQAEKVNL